MIRQVNILVSGKVQGVFFRQSTKNKAAEYGILGTVQNLVDGRVEINAQAEDTNLEVFIQWCRQGPIMARVKQVEVTEQQVNENEFTSFRII